MARRILPSVGVFYNADIRNNGTARRVVEAMFRMGFKDHGMVRYSRPPGVEVAKHDLHLFVDDGRDDIHWMPPEPNACWLVDTHLGFGMRLHWAKQFQHVFVAQKEAVGQMAAEGIEAKWLPLACSPYLDPCWKELSTAMGRKVDLTREYDCCFVGFLNNGAEGGYNRVEVLDRLFKAYPNSWLAFNVFFEEAAQRYVKARVGLNVSIKKDLNMRFFECLSYGVCQVCNSTMDGWRELGFREGEHFLGWKTLEEAVAKIKWALDNPVEREQVAEAGMEAVRKNHTYEDRVWQLLREVGL